jgi:hypothetical protein
MYIDIYISMYIYLHVYIFTIDLNRKSYICVYEDHYVLTYIQYLRTYIRVYIFLVEHINKEFDLI